MPARARGQLAPRMQLARLVLIAVLVVAAAAGLAAPGASGAQPGLRLGRFAQSFGRAQPEPSGDSAGVATECVGSECASRSGGREVLQDENRLESANREEGEDEATPEGGTDLEEGRGRGGGGGGGGKGKKKKGYGKVLIILAGLTKAMMLYFMIHAVAALAGKALIVAKVALAIATALALKKSSEHKTSYEIVKHPQYSHVHTQSSSIDYDHGGGGGGSYEGGSRRRRKVRR